MNSDSVGTKMFQLDKLIHQIKSRKRNNFRNIDTFLLIFNNFRSNYIM